MWLQRILQAEWYLVIQHGFFSWFASNIGNVSCKQVYLGFFSTPPSQSNMQQHDGCNGRWLESNLFCNHWLPSDFTPSTHLDLDCLFCAAVPVFGTAVTHHTPLSFILMDIFRRKRYFKICAYSRFPFWCNLVWCVAKVPVLQIPFISTDRNQVKSIYRAQIRTLLQQKHPTKISEERNFPSITLVPWVSDPCFHGSTTTLSGMNARFIRCCFTGGQRGQRCSFGLQAFCGFHVHAELLSHSWAAEMLMTVDGWTGRVTLLPWIGINPTNCSWNSWEFSASSLYSRWLK